MSLPTSGTLRLERTISGGVLVAPDVRVELFDSIVQKYKGIVPFPGM